MAGDIPLILLLDGNNLAHHLYPSLGPGRKMMVEDGCRLVTHLSAYARDNAELAIELCLDRPPGDLLDQQARLPANLRVLPAEYPQTGDDLLIDRFWFHQVSRHPCLVITNDEEILAEVADADGSSLRVYDFVRRVGLENPVLRSLDELPPVTWPTQEIDDRPFSLNTSIYFRLVEDPRIHRTRIRRPAPAGSENTPNLSAAQLENETVISSAVEESEATPADDVSQQISPLDSIPVEETHYLVTIDSWPVMEGARFLVNAFCVEHRAEYWDLISSINPQNLSHADLRALAELLLHACGHEDDFARRGSLMDRVRLALLQAHGEPLTLEDVSRKTGLKALGLHGRIKSKAGNWLIYG